MARRATASSAKQLREERAFLARLRAALDQSGMTQAGVAEAIGCSASTITEWFQRGSLPKGHLMIQLPRVLGVNGGWLLTGEGQAEAPDTSPSMAARRQRIGLEVMARIESQLAKVREEIIED